MIVTDRELEMRAALFLPLIGTAPWQRELAVTVMRELVAHVEDRRETSDAERRTLGGCRYW